MSACIHDLTCVHGDHPLPSLSVSTCRPTYSVSIICLPVAMSVYDFVIYFDSVTWAFRNVTLWITAGDCLVLVGVVISGYVWSANCSKITGKLESLQEVKTCIQAPPGE